MLTYFLPNPLMQVASMQAELRALQPQLVRTVAEVEELMKTIAKEKAEVVEPKAAVVNVSVTSTSDLCDLVPCRSHKPGFYTGSSSCNPEEHDKTVPLGMVHCSCDTCWLACLLIHHPSWCLLPAFPHTYFQEEQARAQEAADAAKAIKDECEADLAVVGDVH
jgi:hypothetical protein